MNTEPLKHLGKYELQERLGSGGMAEVWKAFDTQLQRYVAIKVLHTNLQADPNFVIRFQHEAQVIASLRHPNIVQVHDFQISQSNDAHNPIAYMVMTYVDGRTLADYIATTSARGQFPPPTQIVSIFTAICLAVDYAHQKGMIHRDLKPSNILLDKHNTTHTLAGEPILTDFGLAKLLGASTGTITATQLGTPSYISPEQVQGYPGNERSDIYALGVILYEIVTGVSPFRGDTPAAVLSQHLYTTPISPALLHPNIPPAVTFVIMTALAKDPNARFARASSMAAALAEAFHVQLPENLSHPPYPPDMPDMATYVSFPLSGPPTPTVSPPSPLSPSPLSSDGLPILAVSDRNAVLNTTPASFQSVPTFISSSGTVRESLPVQTSSSSVQSPATNAAFTPPKAPVPQTSQRQKRRRGIYIGLIALILLAILGSSLGAYLTVFHQNNTADALSNLQVAFLSSGQFDSGTAQGIGDELQIHLQHIPDPQTGKAYYVWLLADKSPHVEQDALEPKPLFTLPLLLGTLTVKEGNASLSFPGTAQHDNLLSLSSRLLITEEDMHTTPRGPSANHSTWRYYAEIPQTPYGPSQLSALDHIRHLFYKETKVQVLGLAGGLDVWLFRNTETVMEWASSARDDYRAQVSDPTLIHNLFLSILDYIDGAPNVQMDTPSGSPLIADPVASKVSLLSVAPAQQQLTEVETNPPGYVDHVQLHLNGVVQAPDATPQMRHLATHIIEALNNAKKWLEQVRIYARQLVAMNAVQLAQASTLTLLDNMLSDATYAYIGQLNPATNQVIPGVLQAHYDIQNLATMTISTHVPQTI